MDNLKEYYFTNSEFYLNTLQILFMPTTINTKNKQEAKTGNHGMTGNLKKYTKLLLLLLLLF